jgi:hypothetical protein
LSAACLELLDQYHRATKANQQIGQPQTGHARAKNCDFDGDVEQRLKCAMIAHSARCDLWRNLGKQIRSYR